MEKTIKNILKELKNEFYKENNKVYIKKDKEEIYNDFRDLIHGTEFLSDDFRYSKTLDLIDSLLDYDIESLDDLTEYSNEIIDSHVSIYNDDLTDWLSSNTLRLDYCNEGISEHGKQDDIIKTITVGQYIEIEKIYNGLVEYISKRIDL